MRIAKPFILSCYLIIIGLSGASTSSAAALPDTLRINSGLISGSRNASGSIKIFKGIPFAAPPVGPLRWQPPQTPAPWSGVKSCTAFSASPMQAKPTPFLMYSEEFLIPKEPISEDCLYLNVWTGASKPSEKRPVIVWIYGGGFATGGAGVPIYDGEAMAKKGIVFVTINYRVGIFGFFAHPQLTAASPNHASGNYGIMDQLEALRWVKKNIAAFGGDPGNVTIAGQSAGSMSVNVLVASPLSKGLFQKAIAESGAFFVNSIIRSNTSLAMAEQDGLKVGGSIDSLRQLSAEDLMKKGSGGFRSPFADGYVLPKPIPEIFAEGKENPVSLLTGWNEDEGFLFGAPAKAADYKKQTAERYGADAETLLKIYPASTDDEAAVSQRSFSRDMVFGVQNYTWANLQSTVPGAKVFVYRFTRRMPADGDLAKYGAFHTAEVPYAYNNLTFVHRPFTPADFALADMMSTYWASFAKTGQPAGQNLPLWPAYNTKTKTVMVLDEKPKAAPITDQAALDKLYEVLNKSK